MLHFRFVVPYSGTLSNNELSFELTAPIDELALARI